MPPSIGKYTMKKKVPCRNFLWSESPSWRDWLSGPIWLSHVSAFVMHHLETEPYVNSACSNALEPHEIRLTFFYMTPSVKEGEAGGCSTPPFFVKKFLLTFFLKILSVDMYPLTEFFRDWISWILPCGTAALICSALCQHQQGCMADS